MISGPTAQVLADVRLVEAGVEPPPAVQLARAAARRGLVLDPDALRLCGPPGMASAARGNVMTEAARLDGVVFVQPGRHAGAGRRGSRVNRGSTGRDRRSERVRQVDAGPPSQRAAPADRGASPAAARRAASTSPRLRGRLAWRSRTPTDRSSPAGSRRGRVRAAEPGAGADRWRGGSCHRAVGLDGKRTPTRTTSATRGGSCSRSRRCSPWGRRSSSSTSRPPARTRAASAQIQRIVDDLAAAAER